MDFETGGPGKTVDIRTRDALQGQEAIRFGSFVLHPQQQLLFRHSQPVPLGSRAMSLLVAFATRPGELLEKAELLTLAWPKAVVEECNLRAQIVTLRRALEEQDDFTYIVTVPGRGYRFSAPVSVQPATAPALPAPAPAPAPAKDTFAAAPAIKRQVLGRDALIRQLHELSPLQVPDENQTISAETAIAYSGVELFVTRAREQDPAFVLTDSDTEAVAAICRKLDGNPLAIELAAARVRTFGIADLVGLLDGSFRLQMTGLRTALPRQRSLSATLDWTYGMLTEHEQALLRQLSIFNGSFTLDGVMAIVNIGLPDVRMTLPMLESLLEKSLLGTFDHSQGKRFRLLETTRLYAHDKLVQLDDVPRLCRAHAQWALRLLNQARLDLDQLTQDVWTQRYAAEIDTIRAALTWAFSAAGDRQLGVELTLSSSPLWLRLSLVREYQDWVSLGTPRHVEEKAQMDRRQRMRLLTMSGSILMLTYGAGQKMREVWQQVSEDAEVLNDSEYRLRALWGQWNDHTCSNRHREAQEVALRFLALGKDYRIADCQLLGRRMRATSAFYMGDMKTAGQAIEEALGASRSASSHIIDMHFDQRIAAQSLRAQVQLLVGNTGQAMVALDTNVKQAIALSHPATLWYTLAISAIPATLIAGTLHKTRHFLDVLKKSSERQPLHIWRQLTSCYESILLIREGNPAAGVPLLGEALQQLRNHVETPLCSMLHTEYVSGLAALRLEPLALETLDEIHINAVEHHDRWYLPEIMRVKAQLMLSQPHTHALEEVRKMLTQALDIARQDGTHFWAWRINADLNRLKIAPGTPAPRHFPAVH
ncbi:LuxR family transcriptional regulator [Pseudomonas amygdali pv. morsprunorum]|uniref:winged helix-turn-helix domain-containing protein n=1 Tax=Pseudomonas amygdali TaxID=47877 RepID=UPI0006B9303A|nr:winged helix-turn-helix domain-containing protein [Pseudomonas amygdali]KPC47213.1 LuxR family transcriptional regulator [Pseudomonas amygdali pv. morsprunorum]